MVRFIILFSLISAPVLAEKKDAHSRESRSRKATTVHAISVLAPITGELADGVTEEEEAKREKNPHYKALKNLINNEKYQERIEAIYRKKGIKLSLSGQIRRWHRDNPKMTTTQLALNLGVLEQGGLSVVTRVDKEGKSVSGKMLPRICKKTKDHAIDMARRYSQDHNGSKGRMADLGAASEIVKETFDGEYNIVEAGRFCGNWTSGTHRPDMMGTHKSFCYDMRMASNGKWFCVGLFSNSELE